ncbi:hypothetical protein O1611_g6262 [Lasiodiplodia mahajangana]|nr:hypothetical protein O1611_g6262 [Lasiodiplodia mahajangana]
MFTRVNTDLGMRIKTATEAAVAGTTAAPAKAGISNKLANMKLADLHAKKQAPHDSPHNFDLFAHKAWHLS